MGPCLGKRRFGQMLHAVGACLQRGVCSLAGSFSTPMCPRVIHLLRYELWRAQHSIMRSKAMTKDKAWGLADDWVAAWNKHDLDVIMAHYDDAVELTSPVAAQLLGSADGRV